jgi:hypothetical protein
MKAFLLPLCRERRGNLLMNHHHHRHHRCRLNQCYLIQCRHFCTLTMIASPRYIPALALAPAPAPASLRLHLVLAPLRRFLGLGLMGKRTFMQRATPPAGVLHLHHLLLLLDLSLSLTLSLCVYLQRPSCE